MNDTTPQPEQPTAAGNELPPTVVPGLSPQATALHVSGTIDLKELTFLRPAADASELGRLGGYRVLHVLGRGGMGMVLHAEDVQLRRPVALKVMKRSLAADDKSRQRFLREAQAAAKLHHDHIITIYQVGEDNGVPFLAMEFLQGETLEDRLQDGQRLPMAELLRIGRETAEGLAAAHEQGLIHRDIKPANIWLEKRGHREPSRVRILDFGLARVAGPDADDGRAPLTQSGMVIGTPQYMAPEQAAGEKVDYRSDLFSLGCVLYRMANGVRPFEGESVRSVLKAVMFEPPRPPPMTADVPAPIRQLIDQLLAKEPKDRPASAAEVAAAIQELEDRLPSLVAAPVAPKTSRDRRGQFVGLAVALLVALAAIYMLTRGRRNESNKANVGDSAAAQPFTPQAPAAKEPFVLRRARDHSAPMFATLAAAVEAAESGDTIEVRGDGPVIRHPITIRGKALTIRAAQNAAPTLVLKRDAADSPLVNIETDSPLTLEGLSFHFIDSVAGPENYRYMIKSEAASLRVANCRFRAEIPGSHAFLLANGALSCEVRNCQAALTHGGAALLNWRYPSNGQLVLENNAIAGVGHAVILPANVAAKNAGCQLVRNSMLLPALALILEEDTPAVDKSERPLRIDARENVLFRALAFGQNQEKPAGAGAEAEALLKRLIAWHDQRNAYSSEAEILSMAKRHEPIDTTWDRTKLAAWSAFWGIDNFGSLQGVISFQGGDLQKKAQEDPAGLLPADFRLGNDCIGNSRSKTTWPTTCTARDS